MKKISPKQLQNQFKTWQVKMPSMWEEIEMFAEQYGILTPTGKVSLRRRNKANFDAFLEVYQKKFGSFTSYEKKIKEEYKRAKENGMTNATNYKEYQQEKSDWAEVRDKFFKVFVSDLKMDYDIVNEEYLYSSSLNKRQAIERLQKEIAERRILPAEDYINKYGTFKPNW